MLTEDRTRLQKIDELYALRLDQYVSLPQVSLYGFYISRSIQLTRTKLVVVGDQSSGKSSVLEGLTNLPFPRDSGLCTRFPTQIVFKRSQTTIKEVSIMAAHSQETSRTDGIAKFGKRQLTSLDEGSFAELLAQVLRLGPL
jgi:GTPase SAR1 family protein